jgi:Sigma-70 region 2
VELPGFREFVQLRYTELLRTAYLLTGTREAAEDLLQSALLSTMRHWKRVDDPMAYVRRAMANQRVSLWRRIGSRELLTNRFPERSTADTSGTYAERDALLTALNRLPARMRAVVVLRVDFSDPATIFAVRGLLIERFPSEHAGGTNESNRPSDRVLILAPVAATRVEVTRPGGEVETVALVNGVGAVLVPQGQSVRLRALDATGRQVGSGTGPLGENEPVTEPSPTLPPVDNWS